MTLYCAETKKIIMQPLTMMTIVEVTLCHDDDTWWDEAKKWFTADSLVDYRVETMMDGFRKVLQTASQMQEIGKREAVFMVRYTQPHNHH
jgi:hypothetical protein